MNTWQKIVGLRDKRFWIFELFTLFYAMGLTALGCVVWGKTSSIELGIFLVCLCFMCSLLTWLIANGRHWFVFVLVYEAVFICLIAAFCVIVALITGDSVFNDLWLDVAILFAFIISIGAVSLLPTMVLAFLGYQLFRKNNEDIVISRKMERKIAFPILNISLSSLNSDSLEELHIGDYWDYPTDGLLFGRYYANQEYVDQNGNIFRLAGKRQTNIINRLIHSRSRELYFNDTHKTIGFGELQQLILKRLQSFDDDFAKSILIGLAEKAKSIKELIG